MSSGTDIEPYIKGLEAERQRQIAVIKQAVYKFAEAVLTRAKELCPVKTGFLVNSGELGDIMLESGLISVEIGFNASYAGYVHEILTNKHPQGHAKFLETAINELGPKFNEFVASRLKSAGGEAA